MSTRESKTATRNKIEVSPTGIVVGHNVVRNPNNGKRHIVAYKNSSTGGRTLCGWTYDSQWKIQPKPEWHVYKDCAFCFRVLAAMHYSADEIKIDGRVAPKITRRIERGKTV